MDACLPPAESAWAEGATTLAASDNAWDYAKVTFSVEKDSYGRYVTDLANPMLVKSVVDEYGNTLDAGEYQVRYYSYSDGALTTDGEDGTASGVAGTYPRTEGTYYIVVGKDLSSVEDLDSIPAGTDYVKVAFTIKADKKDSLEGLKAFQLKDTDLTTVSHAEYSDSQFKYTGNAINFALTVDGKSVFDPEAEGITVRWDSQDVSFTSGNDYFTVTKAGTYTATVTDDETGSKKSVEVKVDAIDLSKDVISIKVVGDDKNNGVSNVTGYGYLSANGPINNGFATVNGEPLAATADIVILPVSYEDANGNNEFFPANCSRVGIYGFEISPKNLGPTNENTNVVGSAIEASGAVVNDVVKFYYNNVEVSGQEGSLNGSTFITGEKNGFDPEGLEAGIAGTGEDLEFSYKVTKDGKEVASYDEPGTYVVTLDAPMTERFASAGHEVVTFTVLEKATDAQAYFVQVDGKSLEAETFPYTGKSYMPTVAVYDSNKNALKEGTDYKVVYLDEEDKVVEQLVEPGTYYIAITDTKGNILEIGGEDAKQEFVISKAELVSASADKAIYAYTGEAIAPTFKANTKKDWTGLTESFDATNATITYIKWDGESYILDGDKPTNEIDWDADTNTEITKASDLKDAGTYKAIIEIPGTNKHFKNAVDSQSSPVELSAVFQISEKAAFSDVSANAWYAESVYSAADFGYMTGLAGTKLFMPESQITRAEVAQVFANMAGQVKDDSKTYPTKFADVEADAWYAQAIAWASQAGIVGGYEGTDTFGTFDNATREQIATMIYRYAKAQGMDVTVEDEAKALSAYTDASELTFGKTAMAWCVEQGIFGVDTDALRPADNMSRAEMAATSVRVQPEGPKQDL